ncbi:MAG: S1C family serine protease [Patescibacteria group bacterium]
MRRLLIAGISSLFLWGLFTNPALASITPSGDVIEAMVFIKTSAGSGSGVIIDRSTGLIMTNDHVIFNAKGDLLPIYLCYTIDAYSLPVCLATGKLVVSYINPDIAFILPDKLIDVKTNAVTDEDFTKWLQDHKSYPYPAVIFRDPAKDQGLPELNEEIAILGFPSAGGDTITITNGFVSGFLSSGFNTSGDAQGSLVEAIKTDAKVNPGNSGGAAIDHDLRLVGVPNAFGGSEGNIGYIVPLPKILKSIEGAERDGYLGKNSISALKEASEKTNKKKPTKTPLVNGVSISDPVKFNVITKKKAVEVKWKPGAGSPKGLTYEYILSQKLQNITELAGYQGKSIKKNLLRLPITKARKGKTYYLYVKAVHASGAQSRYMHTKVSF